MKKLLGKKARIVSGDYPEFKGKTLKIVNVAHSIKENLGYDHSKTGKALCDFIVVKTKEEVPFSLYENEFEIINYKSQHRRDYEKLHHQTFS